ncbi:phage tail protein [Allosphingosinicella sp.]|uniref:phage tail protein n=1 Tax=Allosphingosinicella sp. TaxID=2823234 RepID=UPI00378514D5
MSQPYVGEIRIFGGNFAPAGWMLCQGQLLPISENEVLFQLIGTTYGGDGQSTFALPNLASRVPVHQGTGPGLSTYVIGQSGGVDQVTLTQQQTPSHTHPLLATASGAANSPQGAYFANLTSNQAGAAAYTTDPPNVTLVATSVSVAGGSQPHDNIQPSLALNFIISLFGVFPSQN